MINLLLLNNPLLNEIHTKQVFNKKPPQDSWTSASSCSKRRWCATVSCWSGPPAPARPSVTRYWETLSRSWRGSRALREALTRKSTLVLFLVICVPYLTIYGIILLYNTFFFAGATNKVQKLIVTLFLMINNIHLSCDCMRTKLFLFQI